MLGQGTSLSVATLLLYFLVDEAKHTLSSLSLSAPSDFPSTGFAIRKYSMKSKFGTEEPELNRIALVLTTFDQPAFE